MPLLRRAQRDALKEVLYGGVELLGGHYPVDQPPVERGSRVDYVARKGHLRCPFPADVPGDRHHRGVAEPATSAAGSGETGVLTCTARSAVATSWQPAAAASPCTRATTGWGTCWMSVISSVQG
jgi:hypothetical protein